MAECNGCENIARIEALEKSYERNGEQHGKIFDRIGIIESQNKVTDYQFNQIMDTLKELKNEVKGIKDTPTKRWDTIITVIITVIVSFVVTSAINSIF